MKKPIIGLTPSVEETENFQLVRPGYLESIDRAGGIGIMLPLTDRKEDIARYVELCDGFLFVGGPDIEPWRFSQELMDVCGPQNAQRDTVEFLLLEAALAADKPVLGVCRGIQVLNVALGGTLYQDIPSQYSPDTPHQMEKPYNRDAHGLKVVPETPLAELPPLTGVNSRHHQAILDLAPGLEVMAYSEDGLIEAVWMPEKKFVWAVQWHPESYWEDEGANPELFRRLVEAAEVER